MKKTSLIFFLGLLLPTIIVFRALFLPGPAVSGDAPYFYTDSLKELIAEPSAWTSRGNNFSGPNSFLWISPLMLVYGLLNKVFGINNDVIIRILFYFPSIVLAFVSPVILVQKLGYSKIVQFFASLLYGLNTYFLLLIDGGQVGVGLAYGFFPLTLLFVRRLLKEPSFLVFFFALLLLFSTTVADPRFAAIAVFAVLFWCLAEWLTFRNLEEVKNLKFLVTLIFANILLSLYWLIPTFRLGETALATHVSGLNFLSLLNPLLLFQPHWPQNEFGKISSPPFYFVFLPLLIFGSLFIKKERKNSVLAFCFLFFVFLTKGESEPLGAWYNWLVSRVSFGFAFRDSTKFFAPAILFAGILIGVTGERIGKLLKDYSTLLSRSVVFLIYLYLLFLVHPAILGNLNGVLAGRAFPEDFESIHQKLVREESFSRIGWFPERSPFAFHTEEKAALDAKRLVDERPFASLNVGTFDAFNFLHNDQYLDWFDMLGIKYLVLSGDPRKVSLNDEERKNWNELLSLVSSKNELEKVEWDTTFPVYKNPSTKPHIFAASKLAAIVGGDDIYQKLNDVDSNFSIGNQAFVFFEDGRWDPRTLQGVASESVVLVLNEKDETDLTMSFLQKYFTGATEAQVSQWAVRDANDYLRYKYELLKNGVDMKEFDYGKGIAFSSVGGEKISWYLPVTADGDYILAIRSLQDSKFSWVLLDLSLKKGAYPLTLTNDTGFKVVNVVALIPKKDWTEARRLVGNFTGHFEVVRINGSSGTEQLARLAEGNEWQEVSYEAVSPVRYKINIPEGAKWLVFSDSYNKGWILKHGPIDLPSYPFYSMINGFNPRPEWREAEIVFEGQKDVRWGIYWSTISFLLLLITFLWFYPKSRGEKG